MSSSPLVAIIGRPNVGKSALFNRILRRRQAIVDEAEGVTRDRHYGDGEHFGRKFQLVDTGGIDEQASGPFDALIRQQALQAIEEADSLILVVDAQAGPTPIDSEVAHLARQSKKPLCLCVNKVDVREHEDLLLSFYGLGIDQMIATSATHGYQIAELLDAALDPVPEVEHVVLSTGCKLAIVGRPNVGKSTLVNALLEEERCIVSPTAGTTRDSIDVPLRIDNEDYVLIDTAGLRRKKKENEAVEKFASIRTREAIRRSDVCLLLIDAQQGLTREEKKIASFIGDEGKGCIILANKWDLVTSMRMEHCRKDLHESVTFLRHCPLLFISALNGRNVNDIITAVHDVRAARELKVGTSDLNSFVRVCMERTNPPMIDGKRLRVYYMTQITGHPPTFLVFVNSKRRIADSYKAYLLNQLRARYRFPGMPIRLILRDKKDVERRKTFRPARNAQSEGEGEELASRNAQLEESALDALYGESVDEQSLFIAGQEHTLVSS